MIARARENARGTQETHRRRRLERRSTGSTSTCAARRPGDGSRPARRGSTRRSSESCILFDGLVQNTLPRDEVYHFLQLGRYLERVDMMGRILHAKCQSLAATAARPATRRCELVHWTGLLRSCSAYGAYLRDRARPGRAGGRDPLPRARPRLPPRHPVLRGPLPRVAPGDRRRRRRRVRQRGRAPARPARQRAALHRRRRDLRPRPAPLPRRHPGPPAAASARRSSRPIS